MALTAEEKDKVRAEAERARAGAAKTKAEERKAIAEAAQAEIALEREREKRARELARDDHHRVYRFTKPVGPDSVKACMDDLTVWHRNDPHCALTVVFSSPGGNVIEGMALFDFIQELRRGGHHVTTKALGYAASMAGILLQAGDERVMARESWLLIHEASFGAMGSFGDVEDTVEWIRRIQERILDIFAARSNLSKAQLKRRWHRKDWWISSDEALKWGLVDAVD